MSSFHNHCSYVNGYQDILTVLIAIEVQWHCITRLCFNSMRSVIRGPSKYDCVAHGKIVNSW